MRSIGSDHSHNAQCGVDCGDMIEDFLLAFQYSVAGRREIPRITAFLTRNT